MNNDEISSLRSSKAGKGVGVNKAPEVDIQALATLARVELTDDEARVLTGEVSGILGFVERVQEVPLAKEVHTSGLHNVTRADTDAHESGAFSEPLLSVAPKRAGDAVVVKQVLQHVKKGATKGSELSDA